MKVILIDNYDSFTFNLYQLFGSFPGIKVEVYRNDELSLLDIEELDPDCIVLSPGPGSPQYRKDFGVCTDILTLPLDIPTLGVCLGMQGIGHFNGGSVVPANRILHGKVSEISHSGSGIFNGIPQDITVMRYHSLVVDLQSLPDTLEVIAMTEEEEIMAIRHKIHPIIGIQFHPESFLTEYGREMVENFLKIVAQYRSVIEVSQYDF